MENTIITYEAAARACCRDMLNRFLIDHGLTKESVLTLQELVTLTMASSPEWKVRVAVYAPGLTGDQRFELAMASTPDCRWEVAIYAPGLTGEQRYESFLVGWQVGIVAVRRMPNNFISAVRNGCNPWLSGGSSHVRPRVDRGATI